MCVICISKNGVRQPNENEIRNMWNRNPHGAGYMVARNGVVEIHKGFMNLNDFLRTIKEENFTKDDVVVYHFRISTQGGVNPEMTHPFLYTNKIEQTKVLDATGKLGIVHNGIIPMTSNGDKEYSDTAQFIANYLPLLVKTSKDLENKRVLELIENAINSKMVFLDAHGRLTKVGNFIEEESGLYFSNTSYQGYEAFTKKNVNTRYYQYGMFA